MLSKGSSRATFMKQLLLFKKKEEEDAHDAAIMSSEQK